MSGRPIPLVDLAWQHAQVADEIAASMGEVLASTAFINGPDVSRFEEEFASFTGSTHCVGVANGTDAIELALRAAGVTRDDVVVLPANTFIATAEAVARVGARPVLVDCDPDQQLIDVDAALVAIDATRAKAVIPVDLFGQRAASAELAEALAESDCAVVEDAAQAQGARRYGDPIGRGAAVTATSFYPGKNLGAYGDAGAVITDDHDLADRVRTLANHGSRVRYRHELVGMNSRLDTLQAAVLRAKLRRLDEWNALRRAAAHRYRALLGRSDAITLPTEAPGNEHVWHLFVVRVAERDRILAGLTADGIGAAVHYPTPVHLQPAFSALGYGRGSFPEAERAADEIISLPLYPGITIEQQERVAATLLHLVG